MELFLFKSVSVQGPSNDNLLIIKLEMNALGILESRNVSKVNITLNKEEAFLLAQTIIRACRFRPEEIYNFEEPDKFDF